MRRCRDAEVNSLRLPCSPAPLPRVPPDVQDDLRQAYYATMARNLLVYRELSHILTALSALPQSTTLNPKSEIENRKSKIPVILLKGAALAGTVYPNIALRPMGDVDLLIRVPDLPRVQEMLITQGYASYPDRSREFDQGFGRAKMFTRQTPYPMGIDLHWRLLEWPRGQQATLLTEWLWSGAVERRVADIPALVLSPEAQVLHLTSHLAKHGWQRLLWFYDIAQVIRCYEDELDWDLILAKATEFEILKALQVTLARTVELLAPPRPPSVPPNPSTLLRASSGGEVRERSPVPPSPRACPERSRRVGRGGLGGRGLPQSSTFPWSCSPPALMGNDKEILERLESVRPSLRGKVAFALLTARDKHAVILLSAIARDSLLCKVKFLATVAFPSAEYMIERYQLSDRRKLPLYYAYRLGSWFYFLLRSLLSVLSQVLERQDR